MPQVVLELERLFKTNAFNEVKRKQAKDQVERQFPMLKDFTQGELNNNEVLKSKLEHRVMLRAQYNCIPE